MLLFLFLNILNTNASITEQRLNEVIQKFRVAITLLQPKVTDREVIFDKNILSGDQDPFKAINFSAHPDNHTITIWVNEKGLSTLSPAAALAMLCHKAGHFYGGKPYAYGSTTIEVSSEGQSDYFAAKICLPKMLDEAILTDSEIILNTDIYVSALQLCGKFLGVNTQEVQKCAKIISVSSEKLRVSQEDTKYICARTQYGCPLVESFVSDEVLRNAQSAFDLILPDYNGIETYYPSFSCRYKTAIHAAVKIERPRCWYNP